MKTTRPFTDTNRTASTKVRFETANDGRTVTVSTDIDRRGHTFRRIDLVRLYRWLGRTLQMEDDDIGADR